MENRQALGTDERRRIDDADFLVDVGEQHVEVDRGRLAGHDHDDRVGHPGLPEQVVGQLVERRRTRSFAEAHQHDVVPEDVNVATLERVVGPPLFGPVVENPGIAELLVEGEEHLDQKFFGPADPVAHRAHHRVAPDDQPDVPRKKQIRQRGKGEPFLVQRAGDRPRFLVQPLDHHPDQGLGRQGGQLLGERLGRNHVHRSPDQILASLGLLEHLSHEFGDLVHPAEPLQHGLEPGVLAGRDFEPDQIIVEEVLPVPGRHRLEFLAGSVDQNGLERADFGSNADRRHAGS